MLRTNPIQHYNIEELAGKKIESENGTKATIKKGVAELYKIIPKSSLNKTVDKHTGDKIYARVLTDEEWKDDEL